MRNDDPLEDDFQTRRSQSSSLLHLPDLLDRGKNSSVSGIRQPVVPDSSAQPFQPRLWSDIYYIL